mgnify:CR=1 FL=1
MGRTAMKVFHSTVILIAAPVAAVITGCAVAVGALLGAATSLRAIWRAQ